MIRKIYSFSKIYIKFLKNLIHETQICKYMYYIMIMNMFV